MSSNLLFNTIYLYIFGWWIDIGLILWFIWVLYIRHLVTPSACRILCENIQRMWERPRKRTLFEQQCYTTSRNLIESLWTASGNIVINCLLKFSLFICFWNFVFIFRERDTERAHTYMSVHTQRNLPLSFTVAHLHTRAHCVLVLCVSRAHMRVRLSRGIRSRDYSPLMLAVFMWYVHIHILSSIITV